MSEVLQSAEVNRPPSSEPIQSDLRSVGQTGAASKKRTHRGPRRRKSGFRQRAEVTPYITQADQVLPWVLQVVVMGKSLDISPNNEALLSLMSISAAIDRDVLVTLVQLAPVSGVFAYSTSLLKQGGAMFIEANSANVGGVLNPVNEHHVACPRMYNALVRGRFAVIAAMQCYHPTSVPMNVCSCRWQVPDLGQWKTSQSDKVQVSSRPLVVSELPVRIPVIGVGGCRPFHHNKCSCPGRGEPKETGCIRRVFCLGSNPDPAIAPLALVESLASLRLDGLSKPVGWHYEPAHPPVSNWAEVVKKQPGTTQKSTRRRKRKNTSSESEPLYDQADLGHPYSDLEDRSQ